MFVLFLVLALAALGTLAYAGYQSYVSGEKHMENQETQMESLISSTTATSRAATRTSFEVGNISRTVSEFLSKQLEIPAEIYESSGESHITKMDFSSGSIAVKGSMVLEIVDRYVQNGYQITRVVRKDGDPNSYDRVNRFFVTFSKSTPEFDEEISLEIGVTYVLIDRVVNPEAEYQPYTLMDTLPVAESMVLFYKKECHTECIMGLMSDTKQILSNLKRVETKAPSRQGKVLVHRWADVGLSYSYENFVAVPEDFIKIVYNGTLKGVNGTFKPNVLITRLVEHWAAAETTANLFIHGMAGTGKSTLLKILANACSSLEKKVHIVMMAGNQSGVITSASFRNEINRLTADGTPVVIFIDEMVPTNHQTLAALRNILDGTDRLDKTAFVVCSNAKPEDFGDAFTRAGRFDVVIETLPFTDEASAQALYNYLRQENPKKVWAPFEWKENLTLSGVAQLGTWKSLAETLTVQ
jgi:ABC-type multidrug transport system fused ATPase/permease subunit